MRHTHPLAPLLPFAVFAAAGCSTPAPRTTEGATDTGTAPRYARMAAPATRTPSVTVTARQLQEGIDLFAGLFRADGEPLVCDTMEVPWRVLREGMPPVGDDQEHALCMLYGLDPATTTGARTVRLAWAWRSMAAVADSNGRHALDYTDHLARSWNASGPAADLEDRWTWDHQQRPGGRTYFTAVQVNRRLPADSTDRWEPVCSSDPNSCVLPFEQELQRMYDDNEAEFAGHEDDLYLVFRCTGEVCEDDAHSGPYVAHTITMHLRLRDAGGRVRDLVTDDPDDPAHPFHLRAANYGNLCPAWCGMLEVR